MRGSARYPIPDPSAPTVHVEESIRRSRFITTLAAASTVAEAQAAVERVRAEHPSATHNCWAYLVGPPGSTTQVGMSDDGEPHGTAGRPMLNALQHSGVGDVVAVVTRYFGGTKLGKGGLVRAYTSGVQLALEAAVLVDKVTWCRLSVTLDYAHLEPVKRLCPAFEAVVDDESFAERVELALRLPEERRDAFIEGVTNTTSGAAEVSEPSE